MKEDTIEDLRKKLERVQRELDQSQKDFQIVSRTFNVLIAADVLDSDDYNKAYSFVCDFAKERN